MFTDAPFGIMDAALLTPYCPSITKFHQYLNLMGVDTPGLLGHL
jgi:hypothetical protein